MRYRVCKSFEIESGHMLSKHPGRCRYPHGHSRRVDVVISARELDAHDMVCDFKAIKLAVGAYIDSMDHAMLVNKNDKTLDLLRESGLGERVIEIEGEDPTTEVMARLIYERIADALEHGGEFTDPDGHAFQLPGGLTLERVRVTETSTSWAEYGAD